MIGALIEGAIKRRKVVLGVTLIASIFGLIAYNTMPREANPNIDLPFVAIIVPYPGVSPEDSERLLVRPLETNLQSIEGVRQMNAIARQGSAFVTLEFEPDFDKDRALEEVRAKVDLARGRFPPDAEEAIVQEANFTDQPVIGIVLSGAAPEREFVRITNALRDRLESLPGVLQADISGAREEFLEVTVDPVRMETYRVTSGELAQVIARNNQLVPAGDMLSGSGRFAVKVPGVIEKPEDILSLPIKRNGDRLVTVGDIGDVRRTFKDPTFIARYNGEAAYSVLVSKRAGANVLDTVKAVRQTVEAESKAWPSTVKVDYTFDESEFIERTLLILEGGLLSATLLVMVIIVASLGVRQGLMVGMAIPACFAIAFMMLNAIDVTLNQMVMFGLVLAVGILVDGGIVVVEYAERKMAEGMSKLEAFSVAGTRMFWPVLNGTLTTLCAFVPFMFWNSIPGKFMSFLPLTLFFVLGASIFIALIFTPALGSIFAKERKADAEELAELEKSERGDPKEMKGFMGWYARTLDYLSHHPFRVLAATFAIVIGILVWFASTPHRVEFFLDEDPESVQVYVKARGNLNAQAQDDLVRQVEARVLGMEGVRALYVRSGNTPGSSFGGGRFGAPNDTIGTMEVEFLKYEDRVRLGLKGGELAAEVRRRVADIPGIETEVREPEAGPPTGKAIQVELRSNNPAAINAAADLIKAKLSQDPQIIELEDNRGRCGGRAGHPGPVHTRRAQHGRPGFAQDRHALRPGPCKLLRRPPARPAGHPDPAPGRTEARGHPGQRVRRGRGQSEDRGTPAVAGDRALGYFREVEIHRRRRGGPGRRAVLHHCDLRRPLHDDDHPVVAVQQLLGRGRHPLCGAAVHCRRSSRGGGQCRRHIQLHLGHHDGHGRGGPRGGGCRAQHRPGGQLLPAAEGRVLRARSCGPVGGPAVPSCHADDAGDSRRASALDVPVPPEFPQPGPGVSGAGVGPVGAAVGGRGLGAVLRHPPDADPHPGDAGHAECAGGEVRRRVRRHPASRRPAGAEAGL